MRQPPRDGTTPLLGTALLGAALREGSTHLGRLLALARAETDSNIRAVVSLAGILGSIPVLLILAFFLGVDGVVKLLALPLGSEAAAALIVAAPFIALALGLGWLGARRMALSNLEPWRTWRQIGRDLPGRPRAGAAPGRGDQGAVRGGGEASQIAQGTGPIAPPRSPPPRPGTRHSATAGARV